MVLKGGGSWGQTGVFRGGNWVLGGKLDSKECQIDFMGGGNFPKK